MQDEWSKAFNIACVSMPDEWSNALNITYISIQDKWSEALNITYISIQDKWSNALNITFLTTERCADLYVICSREIAVQYTAASWWFYRHSIFHSNYYKEVLSIKILYSRCVFFWKRVSLLNDPTQDWTWIYRSRIWRSTEDVVPSGGCHGVTHIVTSRGSPIELNDRRQSGNTWIR